MVQGLQRIQVQSFEIYRGTIGEVIASATASDVALFEDESPPAPVGFSGAGQTEFHDSSWSGLSIVSKLEDNRRSEALGVVGSSMVSSTAS